MKGLLLGALLAVSMCTMGEEIENEVKGITPPESFTTMQSFAGQEYRFRPGEREVEMYVRVPKAGITPGTGLMLVSHNWGGTWKLTAPWCDILSDRFNLICISVNYLQSGEATHQEVPYDHGVLQAIDCLRALYHVQNQLDEAKIPFNRRRIYAAGASGGGNVSLMVNKLAPSTFACIIDLCGMPGLTNNIAFGVGKLNAGYSKDPASPKYLTKAMQEIRDPGNMDHLKLQLAANPGNQIVVVHGLDDAYCNVADKIQIVSNMARCGFKPAAHFLTKADVDGKIVTETGHTIGDRPYVIAKFGGLYIEEDGPFSKLLPAPSNLDAKRDVVYPVTGGRYVISFAGEPTIRFEKAGEEKATQRLFENGEELIFPKVINNGLMSSVVIITKNKHAIVYDGGHASDCDHLVELIKQYTDTVDYWFLTHAHKDHAEALIELFRRENVPLKVNNVLYSFPSLEWFSQSDEWTDEIRYVVGGIKALPIPQKEIHKGNVFDIDGVKIEILNDYDPKFKRDACNNSSIASMVTISGKRLLLPGDIGLEMSLKLIEEVGDNLKADIVLMVHHGQGGAKKEFYEKVRPTIAVWETPTWVWDNDNGNGPGSHCLTTNYTKCWMQELKVMKQYRNVDDIIMK